MCQFASGRPSDIEIDVQEHNLRADKFRIEYRRMAVCLLQTFFLESHSHSQQDANSWGKY